MKEVFSGQLYLEDPTARQIVYLLLLPIDSIVTMIEDTNRIGKLPRGGGNKIISMVHPEYEGLEKLDFIGMMGEHLPTFKQKVNNDNHQNGDT